MAANKGKGTKPELLFGKLLWNAGVRYRKNDTSIFGKPDFVIKGHKIAIFCDGEFWHGRNWEIRKNDHKNLFAGIGGFRMAMQNLGGKCVFSSDWDAQDQKTYLLNYG